MDNLHEVLQKADAGDAEAQWKAAYYIVWENIKEDIEPDWLERAIRYFKLAAEQGYTDAMLDLAAMYNIGRGVTHDMAQALYWWKQAAGVLCGRAFTSLGIYDGREEDGTYTRTSYGYFLKGALLNEPESISELGVMYINGNYVEQDQRFAFFLYKKCYELIKGDNRYEGLGEVCLRLGMCYNDGTGIEQNIIIAMRYFMEAIQAYEYQLDIGNPSNFFMTGYNRAKFLLKRINDGKALVETTPVETEVHSVGDLLKSGIGYHNILEYEKAFKRFAKCALYETTISCGALIYLSRMYREGIYVDIDEKFADYLEIKYKIINGVLSE